jgi:hypothetical protein
MKCPGQDSRYWTEEAAFEVPCPECGRVEEFFKDEPTRRCKNCGNRMVNPKMDFGCAVYCKFAAQCMGDLPPALVAQRNELMKHRVAIEMKKFFGRDFKRIGHASKVARYAEEMVKQEQGEPAVVLTAAYLHDIGIAEAERKYQSSAPRYQEQEGPPIAREILEKLGAAPELVGKVCDIIGHHHHPHAPETVNFKVVYDADLIVNLEEKESGGPGDERRIGEIIDNAFLTESGKALARKVLLNQQ